LRKWLLIAVQVEQSHAACHCGMTLTSLQAAVTSSLDNLALPVCRTHASKDTQASGQIQEKQDAQSEASLCALSFLLHSAATTCPHAMWAGCDDPSKQQGMIHDKFTRNNHATKEHK
jgi:hypothetical protein